MLELGGACGGDCEAQVSSRNELAELPEMVSAREVRDNAVSKTDSYGMTIDQAARGLTGS